MEDIQIKKFIDVDKIFKDKAPKVYKYIPRFVIRYLERIAHQDKINYFQTKNEFVYNFDYLANALDYLNATVSFEGLEKLPETGGCILASNHPLGGLDGIALMHVVGKKRKDLKFLVNDLLYNLKNLNDLFVPVNKISNNTADNYKLINEAYESGVPILIFPAGLVSRKQKGIIKDLKWKHSFIKKATELNLPILPVHIEGRLSNFFYRFANFRKFIGIKFNIEMLYLADEMFNSKTRNIHIRFGPIIPAKTFDSRHTPTEWAQQLKEYIYTLPVDINRNFNDF